VARSRATFTLVGPQGPKDIAGDLARENPVGTVQGQSEGRAEEDRAVRRGHEGK
jgi:hypothetical protein